MKKREAIKVMSTGVLGLGLAPVACAGPENKSQASAPSQGSGSLKGNINHSACRWCYSGIELEVLCAEANRLGMAGIDLLAPDEWQTALDVGITCTMANPAEFSLTDGFNDPANHESLQKTYREVISAAAVQGLRNVICFSGNRRELDDETGLENCAVGLEPLVKLAEKEGIVLQMELLNSKVDHADYQCDKTPWGVQLCEKIGSENFKLLYDIYHMQIMEGDIIRTIRDYGKYIGHYHTGGVPGRNEIDERQELYYPAIMKAIAESGYDGYVAQEFIPKDEPLESLKKAIEICDV